MCPLLWPALVLGAQGYWGSDEGRPDSQPNLHLLAHPRSVAGGSWRTMTLSLKMFKPALSLLMWPTMHPKPRQPNHLLWPALFLAAQGYWGSDKGRPDSRPDEVGRKQF